MQWEPSNNLLAQGLHVSLGALFTFLPYAMGWHHAWLGAVGIMAFAFLKDFTFDLWVEHDTLAGSGFDVSMYFLGVILAAVILAFR